MEKIIHTKLKINEYLFLYEYETWKGKKRKTDKRRIKHVNSELAKKAFKEWGKSIRTISNVTILDVVLIKENVQEIVL